MPFWATHGLEDLDCIQSISAMATCTGVENHPRPTSPDSATLSICVPVDPRLELFHLLLSYGILVEMHDI